MTGHVKFDFENPCDCIVFRLYAKLSSTHGPNLAHCATFLKKT